MIYAKKTGGVGPEGGQDEGAAKGMLKMAAGGGSICGTEPQKPLVLVFPFDFLSHYLRCIVLCKMMGGDYDVRFVADDKYDIYVRAAGFGMFDCLKWDGSGILAKLRAFDFSWLNEADLEEQFHQRVDAINTYHPRLVIGDNDPALKMAAEYTGVMYASLHNGYMSKYYAGTRTISSRHPLSKLMAILPKFLAAPLVRTGEARTMRRIHQSFSRLRRRYGLLSRSTYLDEIEGDMNLICDLPELFPQANLPANYYCIGPLVYDEIPDGQYSLEALKTDRPTIYVNMGSSGDWNAVRFLDDPHYSNYNIVTAGDHNSVLGNAILRFAFLPASAILPYTDLVICHGGNGIINQALHYQKRILCRTAYFEQEWNASALERAGWGRSLDGVRSREALRKIVDAWVLGTMIKQ